MGGKRNSLNDMKALANKYNLICKSNRFISLEHPLKWQCKKCGYIWSVWPAVIRKHKGRCKNCAENNRMAKVLNVLKKLGGEYLSGKPWGKQAYVKIRCMKCGKIWNARVDHLLGKHWCSRCKNRERYTIEYFKEIAKERGIECLSKKYINASTPLLFRCKLGHKWPAQPQSVKNLRTGCPECNVGISERICREYFKTIFHRDFPKVKPSWLVNPEGNLMELDGYCENIKLAFEYHGDQHYIKNKLYSRARNLTKQKRDDVIKRNICIKKRVKLIVIPYTIHREDIGEYILQQCKAMHVKLPKNVHLPELSDLNICLPDKIKEMKEYADRNGIICLSKRYLGARTNLRWKCKKCGHKWKATPDNIINKETRCNKCANLLRREHHRKYTIADMNLLAKKRGGKCRSTVYISVKHPLEWECINKHIWSKTPDEVMRGAWCKKCKD